MLCSGDISPGHCDLLRIFDNPNESQDTDITQLLSKQALKEEVRLNPSLAMAHASIGTAYILAGKGEKAIPPLKIAMRLNPVDPNCFHTFGELAIAHLIIGQNEECLEYCEQSLRLRPGYWYSRLIRITVLVETGKPEEARSEASELRNRNPKLCLDDIRWLPFVDSRWNNRLVEGLSRAELMH